MQNQTSKHVGGCININKGVNPTELRIYGHTKKLLNRKLYKYPIYKAWGGVSRNLHHHCKKIECLKKDQRPHTIDLASVNLMEFGRE